MFDCRVERARAGQGCAVLDLVSVIAINALVRVLRTGCHALYSYVEHHASMTSERGVCVHYVVDAAHVRSHWRRSAQYIVASAATALLAVALVCVCWPVRN